MTTSYVTRKTNQMSRTYSSNGRGCQPTGARIVYDDAPARTNWLIVSAGLFICLVLCAGMAYMLTLAM